MVRLPEESALVQSQDGQARSEDEFDAFQQEAVHDTQGGLQGWGGGVKGVESQTLSMLSELLTHLGRHGVHKESEEPVEGDKGHVDPEALQVSVEAWQLFRQQILQHKLHAERGVVRGVA